MAARPALVFYLFAYTAMTLGAFAVASWVGRRGDERTRIDEWSGLARKRPLLALAMTVFLLSLGGFPPTGGFLAKFYLFRAVADRPDQRLLLPAHRGGDVLYFRQPASDLKIYPTPATGAVHLSHLSGARGLGSEVWGVRFGERAGSNFAPERCQRFGE